MSYHRTIQNHLTIHVQNLENIGKKEVLHDKVLRHLEKTIQILELIKGERPENYKTIIEYLYQEGRNFGWSFPESSEEEICEKEFWKLKESMKLMIQGMTANERLYFFGYLDEYKNLKQIERSARENIELKLFMK
jgi:hypothetical protein